MTDMQTSLLLLIVWPSILNSVINFSTHLWPVKWNALGYTFALCIPFLPISLQHMHQHDQQWYDPLHIITWSYWFINLDFTCFSPLLSSIGTKSCSSFTATWSISPKPLTCPSLLQPVHQVKSYLDLLLLNHMTQCHVSCVMSSFIITCVSFATSPSHFHLHGICCSHTRTCGLITYVFHIKTISPPRLSLNYQNHTGTFHLGSVDGIGKSWDWRSNHIRLWKVLVWFW